MVNLLNG